MKYCGNKIKCYHAEDKTFFAPSIHENFQSNAERIKLSGSYAHHQNGVVEP